MSRSILLAAALVASLAPAQQPGTIQGVVHDEVGGLVPSAEVRLIVRDRLVGETQTDSVGTFRLDAPAAAGYSLHVVKPGLCIGRVSPANMAYDPINVILETPEKSVPSVIPVSSRVQQRDRLIRVVQPDYPPNEEARGVGGTVTLNVLIDEYGVPANIQASLDYSPLFIQAALAAVEQWRYRPTALNCVPVQVETDIRFEFVGETGAVL